MYHNYVFPLGKDCFKILYATQSFEHREDSAR